MATDTVTRMTSNDAAADAPDGSLDNATDSVVNGMGSPDNAAEAARLAALHRYNILDTPREAAFDDLTLLASTICQTPIAAVTLIDEHRQWFKSTVGLEGTETPREIAFCSHTIRQADLLIVEDATRDARFADNPSVLSDPPHIRFYAGAPLITSEGYALGSLCVVDREPRRLTAQQEQALQALGRQVTAQIEMRRNVQQLSVALEERDAVADALRDSESRFRLLAENSSDLIARYSPQGRCLYASPASLPVLGYAPEELLGRLVYDFVHPDDLQQTLGFHEGRTDLPETYQIAARAQRKDGSVVWLETTGHTIRNQSGEIVEFHTSSRDVTARRQAEEALRQSEERYRELIENSIDLIYQTDAEGRFTFFNGTAMRLMKYSREELLGLKYFDLIDPDYRAATRRFYNRQFVRKMADTYYEYPTVAKDGTVVWFGQNVHLQIEDGQVIGFEAVARDITARKMAEAERTQIQEALQTSEAEMRALVQAMTDVILVIDRAGRFLKVAPSNPALLYRPPAELEGRTLHELFPKEQADTFLENIERALDTQTPVNIEYQMVIDNTTLWFDGTASPMLGGGERVVWVARDVTARKLAEEKRLKMSQGLSAVLNCADDLLLIADLDSLLRRAIELARERLGLERCSIFLVSPDLKQVRGTFGTDRFGNTTDQRVQRLSTRGDWHQRFAPVPPGQRWGVLENRSLVEWNGQESTSIGKDGWVAVTRIESPSGPIGSFHNDAGLNDRPLDEAQQEIVAVYCSLLGNIIERKRGEEALVHAREQLELRVRERTSELAQANAVLQDEIIERVRAQENQQFLTEGLKAVLSSADELLVMPDLDSLMRHAVELGRERLGLERCSLFLFDAESQKITGTYGINSDGTLVSQYDNISDFSFAGWQEHIASLNDARWSISQGAHADWREGRKVMTGKTGWWVGTQIQSASGPLGVMFNDTAITGAPSDSLQQEMVALFCSLLANMIDRKRAEAALRQSEVRFRLLTEAVPEIVWMANGKGDVEYFNHRWLDYSGLTLQQSLEWGWKEVIHPDDWPNCLEKWTHSLRTGHLYEIELRFKRHDGICRWHLVRALPLRDSQGETVSWVGTCTDIDDQKGITEMLRRSRDELEAIVVERTREISQANHVLHAEVNERKQAEIALRDSDERFRAFMNNSSVAAFMKSAEGRFVYVNQPLCRRFDITPEDWLGKTDFDVMAPEIAAAVAKNDRQVLESGEVNQLLETVPTPDGASQYWLVNKFPLQDVGGQKYLGGIAIDVTDQKRAEAELHLLAEELQRSNAELEQFAYIASHDLQEPLRVVVSFLQLLEKRYGGQLEGDGKEFLDYAVDGSRRMQRLINDLLDYSRVGTRGKAFAPVDTSDALKNALLNLDVAIEESGAQVTLDALPTVPGDASQLTRLFQNLVGNALKFHDKEAPRVHVSATESETEWVFSVRDNGIGIAPEYRARIFAVFQRLHTRTEYPGTGIGLAICKKTVELHGGHIWVESQHGEGATFCFTLSKTERNRRPNIA